MSVKEHHSALEIDSCKTEGEEEWNLKRKINNDNTKMVSSADGVTFGTFVLLIFKVYLLSCSLAYLSNLSYICKQKHFSPIYFCEAIVNF